MYKALAGIEHLMTGLQIVGKSKDQVFTFERESASIVAILSEDPFDLYWVAKQSTMWATEVPDKDAEPQKWTGGEAEWYARVVAQAMNEVDSKGAHDYANLDPNAPPLPEKVIRAMRARYGAMADTYIRCMRWDALNKCWGFAYAGMYVGVEPDGYIHT